MNSAVGLNSEHLALLISCSMAKPLPCKCPGLHKKIYEESHLKSTCCSFVVWLRAYLAEKGFIHMNTGICRLLYQILPLKALMAGQPHRGHSWREHTDGFWRWERCPASHTESWGTLPFFCKVLGPSSSSAHLSLLLVQKGSCEWGMSSAEISAPFKLFGELNKC